MAWMRAITSTLLRRRHQPQHARVLQRVLPVAHGLGGTPDGLGQAVRIGRDVGQHLVDLGEEVAAQPRHAGELAPVGDLVQGDPQPELPGREPVAPLEAHDVRSHVGDGVARGVTGEEKVVLAEDPGRHPAQDEPELSSGRRPGGSRHRPLQSRRLQLTENGIEQVPERREVVLDPAGTVDHPGPGLSRQRPQAGGLDHQTLGLGRHLGEILFQPGGRGRVDMR